MLEAPPSPSSPTPAARHAPGFSAREEAAAPPATGDLPRPGASARDQSALAAEARAAAGASPSDTMRAWTHDTALAALEPVDLRWNVDDDVPPVGRGLRNLGNSCFLNSILQALTHTAPLAKLCQSRRHTTNCALTNANEPCAFCIIERHVCAALAPRPERPVNGGSTRWTYGGGYRQGGYNTHGGSNWYSSHDDAIAPEEVFGNLRLLARHFTRGRQEDAHELLRLSLESMDDSCLANCGRPSARGRGGHRGGQSARVFDPETGARLAPPTAVERIFQGKFRNLVKCQRCQGESKTFDPFLDVSLELPGREDRSSHGGGYYGSGYLRGADTTRGSVDSALRNFTEEEKLEGENAYRCERCDDLCPATKRLTIHEAPAALVVHLKRFDHYGGKINSPVDFTERLTLEGHMSEDAAEAGPKYRLYAMVTHAGGSVSSGHYYAFVRKPAVPPVTDTRERESPDDFYGTAKDDDDEWYLCDDSSVRKVSRSEVFHEQAYVLFYERDDGEGPPPHAVAPLDKWGPDALKAPKTVRTPSPPVDEEDDGLGSDSDDPVHVGAAIGPMGPPRGHPAAGHIPHGPDDDTRTGRLDPASKRRSASTDGADDADGEDEAAPPPAGTPPLGESSPAGESSPDEPAANNSDDDEEDARDGHRRLDQEAARDESTEEAPAWATRESAHAGRPGVKHGLGARTMARRQRRKTDGEEGER